MNRMIIRHEIISIDSMAMKGKGRFGNIEARSKPKLLAVAVDLDGTLTDAKRWLCLNAIEALRKVEIKGIRVILASGNIVTTSAQVSKLLGFSGPVIAENGGVVHYKGVNELFGDKRDCLKALEHVKTKLPAKELFTNQCRLTEICIEEEVGVNKVKALLESYPVDVNSTGFGIHIMPKGMDKIVGLKRACTIIGISLAHVMAIGDSENDIKMVGGCGVGVAVANAPKELKSVADYISKSPNGAGVVEALKHFKLL
jgi:phosphoglycolate phosphatase (TIGR01487 family)